MMKGFKSGQFTMYYTPDVHDAMSPAEAAQHITDTMVREREMTGAGEIESLRFYLQKEIEEMRAPAEEPKKV